MRNETEELSRARETARTSGEAQWYDGINGGHCTLRPEDHYADQSLESLLGHSDQGSRIVYPSGTTIPLHAVFTVWLTERRPFLASGVQMLQHCHRWGIAPVSVFSAPEDRVHGTCLFCSTEDDWWMVQPETLPSFLGV
jgi:hypothetical protein